MVAPALLDRHLNVDALAFVGAEGEPVEAALVANLGLGRLDGGGGIALVFVSLAHALGVFFELGGVVGLREEILKDDGVGYADRFEVLHGAAQIEAVDVPVPYEGNLSYLDHRSFLDVEGDLHRGRRNSLDISFDGGELVAVLGEKLLDDGFSVRDPGRVVLALDRQADLFFLKAVKDVGVGNRIVSLVDDVADGGLLADKYVEDDALLRVLALDAKVFKVAGIPK